IRQVTQDLEFLSKGEGAEIDNILRELTKKIEVFYETLNSNLGIFNELDLIQAKALYAMTIDAIKPHLNNQGNINLKECRHPLLDKEIVVPIDVRLTKEQPILLITGPNTGGKTVALKTVGLFTLMAQT